MKNLNKYKVNLGNNFFFLENYKQTELVDDRNLKIVLFSFCYKFIFFFLNFYFLQISKIYISSLKCGNLWLDTYQAICTLIRKNYCPMWNLDHKFHFPIVGARKQLIHWNLHVITRLFITILWLYMHIYM